MIRKPRKMSFRMSEDEYAKLDEARKLDHSWEPSIFIRRAIAHYAAHLFRERDMRMQGAQEAAAAPVKKLPRKKLIRG